MLNFQGRTIPGTHSTVHPTPPSLQAKRTKFMGVIGESQINGRRGGRTITCRIWIHNQWTDSTALMQFLADLDYSVGAEGDLIESGTVNQEFKDCTFEGFFRDGGPLPDASGSLDGVTPSWWIEGTLQWWQPFVGIESPSFNQ